jgi:hypothetical protein
MHRVREPDAGNPPVRFDERGVEPEHGRTSEAPATERAGNSYVHPTPPAHTSTLSPQAAISKQLAREVAREAPTFHGPSSQVVT